MDKKQKAKIQPTSNQVQKQIDYVAIIDEMNDVTFAFCKQFLYPVFEYQVMKEEDIRKIDIQEQLVSMQNVFLNEKGKKQGFLNYYLSLIKKTFFDQWKYESGSRAERTKDRACEAMNMALEKRIENNRLDIEDYVLMFISLYRELTENRNRDTLSDVSNELRIQDADLLLAMYEYGIKPMGVSKLPVQIVKVLHSIPAYAMKVLYVNSMIYLCIGLQSRGMFSEA